MKKRFSVIRSRITMTLGLATLAFASFSNASAIDVVGQGASPTAWTSVTQWGDTIGLVKSYTKNGWTGYVDIDATTAAPGTLLAQLFEVGAPFTGQVRITGPGLDRIVAAGAAPQPLAFTLLEGVNRFQFTVSGTGSDRWQLMSSITAVPLPAAVWLFGSALVGLVVVGRRRRITGR
jgi:hypothetical protein